MNELMTKLKAKRPQIGAGALVLVLIWGGMTLWRKHQAQQKKLAERVIALAKRTDIAQTIAANGRVVPNFEVEIKPKASGKIIKLPYDVSAAVKEGDLLVQLDPIDESRAVAQAEASLSSLQNKLEGSKLNSQIAQLNLKTELDKARANLSAAETRAKEVQAKFDRQKKLYEGEFISTEEFQTSTTELAQAKTDLENAKVRFKELNTQQLNVKFQQKEVAASKATVDSSRVGLLNAQQRLSETKIYAPINGVVTSRPAQIGLIVSSGINNVSGGTTLMTIADLSQIFTIASVDESDIGRVKLGQKARITADAFGGEKFAGEVVQIASKGLNESNVVTFEVKIKLLGDAEQKLKPEMTTNIEIIVDEASDAVVVPIEALNKKNGHEYVLVLTDRKKKPTRRAVQTGISDGTNTQITAGLEEGETVLVRKRQADKSRWKKDKAGSGGGMAGTPRGMMMGGGRR
jgi:HlyD family secretion protein